MIADVSIAYGHHARSLAVWVIAAMVLALVLTGAALLRAWLLDDPGEDVLGDVERDPERRALRTMASTQHPGSVGRPAGAHLPLGASSRVAPGCHPVNGANRTAPGRVRRG